MAIFNPEPNPTSDPNYLNQSRGTDRAQADLSTGIMLKGIGNIVGAVAKGTAAVAEDSIDQQIKRRVNEERNPIIEAYEQNARQNGPTVETNNPLSLTPPASQGPYVPPALNAAMGPIENLARAQAQGKLQDSSYYYSRLQGIVRDVKSQFPGYEDIVDQKIKQATGIVPANALVQSLFTMAHDQRTQAMKERTQIRTALIKYSNDGMISPRILQDFDAGNLNPYEALSQINRITSQKYRQDRELADINLDEARNKNVENKVLRYADGYAGDFINNRVSAMLDTSGDLGQLLEKVQKAQEPGGVQMTPQELSQASNGILQAKTAAEMQLREHYSMPQKALGGVSIQSKIGSAKVNEIIKKNTEIFDAVQGNLGFDKIGLAVSAANIAKVTTDHDYANALLTAGPAPRNLAVINRAGGSMAAGQYLASAQGQKDLDQFLKATSDGIILGQGAGTIRTMKDAANIVKNVQRFDPDTAKKLPASSLINNTVTLATHPLASPELSKNLLGTFFNPENRGFVTDNFAPKDQIRLYNMMTSPRVAKKMAQLKDSDPEFFRNYVNWSQEEGLKAFRTKLDDLQQSFEYAPGVSVHFNPETFRIIVDQDVFGDSFSPTGSTLRGQVDEINQFFTNLRSVYEADGRSPDDSARAVLQVMQGMGFNPDTPKKDTMLDNIFNAIGEGFKNLDATAKGNIERGRNELKDMLISPAGASELENAIATGESSNNPNAANPRSSALGTGQFLDSTWKDLLTRHRPDLVEGKSPEEISALRTNDQLSREMIRAYAQDNAKALSRRGIEPTRGNVYLAHFAGAGGASKILKAKPNESAAEILGPAATEANPWLIRFTARGLAEWAEAKSRQGARS